MTTELIAQVKSYLLEPDMSKPLNAIDTLRVHAGGDDSFFGKDDADTILEYLETLLRENDRLRRENEHFTKSGIIEVAIRNISVSDYMNHWEGRAADAEAKLAEAVKWVDAHLSKTAMLPKRVDEMNEVEADIFKIAAYHMGFLQFLLQSLSALIPEKKEG